MSSSQRQSPRHVGLWAPLASLRRSFGAGGALVDDRRRRLILSSLTGVIAKLVSVATLVLTMPLTSHYLGPERFGLWMLLASTIAMMSFADLGIGSGLITALADAKGRNDREEMTVLVSSGYSILIVIGAVVATLYLIFAPYVDWSDILNIKTQVARDELWPSLSVVVLVTCIGIPVAAVTSIQFGLQMAVRSNTWQMAASLLVLMSVATAVYLQASLPALLLIYSGVPVLVNLLSSTLFFARVKPGLRPSLSKCRLDRVKLVMAFGVFFFINQVTQVLTYSSDGWLIARSFEPSAVGYYSTHEKIFSFASVLMATALLPLWPAIREAQATGDTAWVRRNYFHALRVGSAAIVLAVVVLYICAPMLIRIWMGGIVPVSMVLLLNLAILKVLEVIGLINATLLSGLNFLKLQIAFSLFFMATTICLKLYFLSKLGVDYTPLANGICYVVTTVVPGFLVVRRYLSGRGSRVLGEKGS